MADGDFSASRLTVRLGAIAANYRHFVQLGAHAAAVVKADGYGLGAERIAPALSRAGCDSFFVARLSEAVALRAVLSDARIFLLDGVDGDTAPALIRHRLTPVLNTLDAIAVWAAAARAQGAVLDGAIQVDTGMNRLGLTGEDVSILAAEHKARLAGIDLVLVMSHLACADDLGPDAPMNRQQLARFRAALAVLPSAPASLAASSGTFLGRDFHFDLVRPGVGLYGGNPCPGRPNPMKSAAVLEGRVLQTRRIDSGETVGYAATFRAKRPTMLATVALGYADGIPRALSNTGMAALGQARAPIAGRVSMDMTILDVTDMPNAPRAGDWCEMLGDTILLDDVAAAASTNAYEILTRLGRRVPRRYTDEAA